MTRQEWAKANATIEAAVAELERLRAWKSEALIVLAQWEQVWDALGSPGLLGQSKSAASTAEIRRLLAARPTPQFDPAQEQNA